MLVKTVCRFVKSGWSYNDARKDGMVYSVAELGLPIGYWHAIFQIDVIKLNAQVISIVNNE